MSPNAYVHWNDEKRLLYGFQGEAEHEEPVFTWTYSTFEEYLGEACTPSMYNFFTEYICEEINKEELYEIQGGDYCPGRLEEEAVDAYFALPIKERIELHMQEMKNLEAERDRASAKETAFIDALLDEACPFDVASPIYVEYCQWCREQKEKWAKIHFDLCCQLDEETEWRGGHEEGAEDDVHLNPYDPMEEF
jgi:hypothetical protein